MSDYKMLDLFSGLKGASQAMLEDDGWEVTTVDIEEKFEPDICADILSIDLKDLQDEYDLIWASPPCQTFSMASMSHYWDKIDGEYIPKRKRDEYDNIIKDEISEKGKIARDHLDYVIKTIELINELNVDYWFIENPKAMLSSILKQESNIEPSGWVSYCQYGEDRMEPTHLWGDHPDSFRYKHCHYGADCHVSAPRGSKTGTQGMSSSTERAKVPYLLSKDVKRAVESPDLPKIEDFGKVEE